MKKVVTVHNLSELKQFWADVLPLFAERCILMMKGAVGAGKTHSVKSIAEIKKLKDVASPSFAIHHSYQSDDGFHMDHVDLYRLESEDDLESTGFWDLFSQEHSLVVIEWAERISIDALPMNWQIFEVKIEILSETQRRITLQLFADHLQSHD